MAFQVDAFQNDAFQNDGIGGGSFGWLSPSIRSSLCVLLALLLFAQPVFAALPLGLSPWRCIFTGTFFICYYVPQPCPPLRAGTYCR